MMQNTPYIVPLLTRHTFSLKSPHAQITIKTQCRGASWEKYISPPRLETELPLRSLLPTALLWHASWPFTLMAGTVLCEAVTLRAAYNKISLLFQLTWQTPRRTNAYNCQHLVWDLINVVFFQVRFPKAKWKLQSPSTNAGTCSPPGDPGTGHYYSALFREVLSETKAIYLQDQMRRRKSTSWDDITSSWIQGFIYLLCDNGPNVYTTPKSAMKIQTSL